MSLAPRAAAGAALRIRQRLPMRLLRRLSSVALALALADLAAIHRAAITRAFTQAAAADHRWLAAAVAAEAVSILAYVLIVRRLLAIGGVGASLLSLTGTTVAGIALLNTLPAGQAVSSGYWFQQLHRRGAARGVAAVALFGAGLVGALSLVVLTAIGFLIGGSAHGALAAARTPVLVGAAIFIATRVFAHRPLKRGLCWMVRRLTGDETTYPIAAVKPREYVALALLGYVNWIFDCLVLVFALDAVHAAAPWRAILVVYALAQLATAVPILPGGGGTVEASLTLGLATYGAHGAVAAAIVIFRVISAWAFVPIGLLVWG